MIKTFRHAGDLGDIIYSLPVIRHMGGGELLIEATSYTRVKLTRDRWCGIDNLLKQQPYISGVSDFNGHHVDVNLNDFRAKLFHSMRRQEHKQKSLVDWFLETHQIPYQAKESAWLMVDKPTTAAKVIINRTGPGRSPLNQYHNALFPWYKIMKKYKDQAMFIGLEAEYKTFCDVCGEIPWFQTKDLACAAEVIAGCDLFIGNQSVCHAIAEGMKKDIVLEVWPNGPNCLHFRKGAHHGWDNGVYLPDIS